MILSYFQPMKSIAYHHFPLTVFDGTNPLLFNPVLKKRLKNRPEERIRLRWVEYLIHQTDWPKSRIGFEAPVQLRQEKNALRADLILYNKEMKPEVLIECKAESIRLSQSVAEQAARYNTQVGAPFICLTNGLTDFWFHVDEGRVSALDPDSGSTIPFNKTVPFSDLKKDLQWWSARGFCSLSFPEQHSDTLSRSISHFWSQSIDWTAQYLNFPTSPIPIGIQQYYRIPVIDNHKKLAISFVGAPNHSSYLVAILNEKGQNRSLLTINLNKLAHQHEESGSLMTEGSKSTFAAHKTLPLFQNGVSAKTIEQLPVYLMRFFD
jgi:hypothetical protein